MILPILISVSLAPGSYCFDWARAVPEPAIAAHKATYRITCRNVLSIYPPGRLGSLAMISGHLNLREKSAHPDAVQSSRSPIGGVKHHRRDILAAADHY